MRHPAPPHAQNPACSAPPLRPWDFHENPGSVAPSLKRFRAWRADNIDALRSRDWHARRRMYARVIHGVQLAALLASVACGKGRETAKSEPTSGAPAIT